MKYELSMSRLNSVVRGFIQEHETLLTLNTIEMDEFKGMSAADIRWSMSDRYKNDEVNPYHETRSWADEWRRIINFNIRELSRAITSAAMSVQYHSYPHGIEHFVSLTQAMTLSKPSTVDLDYSQEDLCAELFDPLYIESTTMLTGLVENAWAIPTYIERGSMIQIAEGDDYRIATYHTLFNNDVWSGKYNTPEEWLTNNANVCDDIDSVEENL